MRSSHFLWCLVDRIPPATQTSVTKSGISSSPNKSWMSSSTPSRKFLHRAWVQRLKSAISSHPRQSQVLAAAAECLSSSPKPGLHHCRQIPPNPVVDLSSPPNPAVSPHRHWEYVSSLLTRISFLSPPDVTPATTARFWCTTSSTFLMNLERNWYNPSLVLPRLGSIGICLERVQLLRA
jgi:hypothetical protein